MFLNTSVVSSCCLHFLAVGRRRPKRVVYSESNDDWCELDCPFVVYDSLGVVPDSKHVSSNGDESGVLAGTYGWAKWMADSQKWEVVQLGEGCL